MKEALSNRVSLHGQWSSRLTFILVATGAAVGLGNVWKFPYTAGQNGGAAFILVYLLCVMLIGIPVLVSEIVIGRRGGRNPIDALQDVAKESGRSPHWRTLGWLGMVTLLLTLSFYSVVAGWSLAYMWRTWSGDFVGLGAGQISAVWAGFISDPLSMLMYASLFLLVTLWVVAGGVVAGLERASNILMPLLFGILLILVGYAASTEYWGEALQFMFAVDWSKITSGVIIDAMGQAFFTLAIGAGAMLVYGAYLKKDTPIWSAVFAIAGLDVIVAVLAGMAIFPIAFANGLTLESGPGLVFQVLPTAFAQMGAGQILGTLFFILLFFTAWTSSISMAEPLVMTVVEKMKLTRKQAALVVGGAAWIIAIVCVLSFNSWQDLLILGRWTIFGAITDLVTNILLPIGGLFFAVLAGWGLHRRVTYEELGTRNPCLYRSWLIIIRFIAPVGILVILIAALL